MKTYYIITISLILLCFSSCKDNSTDNSDSKQFYPLSVDNYWKYKIIHYDSLGGGATYDSSILIEKVNSEIIIKGDKWYSIDATVNSFVFSAPYKNVTEGLITTINDTTLLLYKYPANINDVFSDSIKVVATEEMVSTLAGNFKCMVYQQITKYSPGWIYTNTYVSPGTGKVKIEGSSTTDKTKFIKRVEYNLMEYKVN